MRNIKITINIPVKIFGGKNHGYCGRIECKRSDGLQAYPDGKTQEELRIAVQEQFQMYIDSLFEED